MRSAAPRFYRVWHAVIADDEAAPQICRDDQPAETAVVDHRWSARQATLMSRPTGVRTDNVVEIDATGPGAGSDRLLRSELDGGGG
jgi:hypothetical protein